MGRCLLDCIAVGMVSIGTVYEPAFTANDFSRCDEEGDWRWTCFCNIPDQMIHFRTRTGHRTTVSFFFPPGLVFFAPSQQVP
jgi:hypothetical protein